MTTLTHSPFAMLAGPPAPLVNPLLVGLEPVLRALSASPTSRLLVLGAKLRNFTRDMWESDRVVVWNSDMRRAMDGRIPSDVAAVVLTRWVDHNGVDNVRREAKRIGATFYYKVLTPHTIQLLAQTAGLFSAPLSHVTPEPMPMPTPTPQTPATVPARKGITARKDGAAPLPTGMLSTWLAANVGTIPVGADIGALARTLMPKLQAAGIPTTHYSLTTTMYRQRKAQQGIVAVRKNRSQIRVTPSVERVTVQPSGEERVMLHVDATEPHPETTLLEKKLNGILGLIDEQQTALGVLRDEILTIQPLLTLAEAAATELPVLRNRLARMAAALHE